MRLDHRGLWIAFGVLVVIVLLGPFLGGGMMGPGMIWGYGVPVGGLGMSMGWLAPLAFWGALIVGAILLVRWAIVQWPSEADQGHADALAILRRRYAAGEIDQATYERMRWELSGTTDRAPGASASAGGRTNGPDEDATVVQSHSWPR